MPYLTKLGVIMAFTLDMLFDVPLRMIAELMPDIQNRVNFERTCTRFHSLTTNLYEATERVVAIVSRLLPQDENGLRALGASPPMTMEKLIEGNAANELDDFYQVYKRRMAELRVPLFDEMNLETLNRFRFNLLPVFLSANHPDLRQSVLDNIIRALSRRIGADVRKKEDHLFENISSESFKAVHLLSYRMGLSIPRGDFFQMILRRNSRENIATALIEFQNPAPDAPRFLAAQERIKRELTEERKAVEEQIAASQVKHDAAKLKWEKAQEEMDQAYAALLEACPESLTGDRNRPKEAVIMRLKYSPLTPPQLTLLENFIKKKEFAETFPFFEGIEAPWSPVFTMRLESIDKRLKPEDIETMARLSMDNNVQFFQDLHDFALTQ